MVSVLPWRANVHGSTTTTRCWVLTHANVPFFPFKAKMLKPDADSTWKVLLDVSRRRHTPPVPTDDVSVYSVFTRLLPERYRTGLPRWPGPGAPIQPGPHLRLICLATENNHYVIRNLGPGVKYGERIWLPSRNSIPQSPVGSEDFWHSLPAASRRRSLSQAHVRPPECST